MMDHVGVDKVGLHTRAYTVTNGLRGWSEKGGRKVGEAPPCFLHDHTGQPIEGTGFYLQTEHAIMDVNPTGLLVTFNPSKVLHPWHLLTDPSEVGRIADGIERTLKANGVLVNVNAMQTVRVDLAKQKQLTHQLTTYVPALSHLKGKRMTGHTYPDGYSFRNTQREAVFYNKAREVLEKQRITVSEDRLGRFEVKWKKGRPLAKDLQLSAFGDLRRADPEQLATVYREALHRDVFRTDPKAVQLVLNLDTEADILRGYLQAGRGGAYKYLLDLHTGPHVEALGGWDAFGHLLRDAGMKDRTVRHTLQQLRQQAQRAAFVNARRDKAAVNLHTLLDELKHAFAA
jgi:hypothetical protein